MLRFLPRAVIDLGPRFALIAVVTASLLAPLWMMALEHSPPAGAAVAEAGLPAPGLYRLTLIGAALWLWAGVASRIRCDGSYRFFLSRPIHPSWLYLARWLAPLPWLVLLGILWAVAASATLGVPAPLRASVAAALATGLFVGSLLLLVSAVLDRGDAFVVALLFLIEAVSRLRVMSSAGAGKPATILARLLRPLGQWQDLSRALSAGEVPSPSKWGAPAAFAGLTLLLALVILTHREMKGP